jgi:predicted ferric reductase
MLNPISLGINLIIWAIDLYFYDGNFKEVHSDSLMFGELKSVFRANTPRIIGEFFASCLVTLFAFNFLMITRAHWVEKIFGGLDKMIFIHKRTAIIAVFLVIAHIIVVPKDLTEFTIEKPFGIIAFILIMIGVTISAAPPLKKKIPYHKWIIAHKMGGILFIFTITHHVIFVNSLIKELPITRVYVLVMSMIGIAAWFYRTFLYKFFNKEFKYTIVGVQNMKNGITELSLKPDNKNLQFEAGQFCFFRFLSISEKEQHPFTISSHPSENNIRLSIKKLGDFTNEISRNLITLDKVMLEGPYGNFKLKSITGEKQIWIAGGIGITPFLSIAQEKTNKSNYSGALMIYRKQYIMVNYRQFRREI